MTKTKDRGAAPLPLLIILWAALIFIDQLTKSMAVKALAGGPIILWKGVLELRYLENTGAAFSLMENRQFVFYIVAIAAIAGIFYILVHMPRKERRFVPLQLVLTFISAGAAGNLIDRIQLHYVRDFIYFSLINFPVFNVADIYVTCGVALLIWLMLFYYKEDELSRVLPENRHPSEK